jgi:hypothetical protein
MVDGFKLFWEFVSKLPPLSYGAVIICFVIQAFAVYYGARASSKGVAVGSGSPTIVWKRLPLQLGENPEVRTIASYRMAVDWMVASLAEGDGSSGNQSISRHRLFYGMTTVPLDATNGLKIVLRAKQDLAEPGVGSLKLAAIVATRRGPFTRIEWLNLASGEPTTAKLKSEKEFVVRDLQAGDVIEVVVAVKASTQDLFNRIEHSEPSQLIEQSISISEEQAR